MLLRFAPLTLWLCLVASPSPAFAQVTDVPRPLEVEPPAPSDHFALGVAALEAGDFQGAYDHLLEDYRATPSYRTAAVLGQAAGELGRHAEAATLIASSLRDMPDNVAPEVRKPIEDYLLRMQEHVTTVEVSVSPIEALDQLEVQLDGAPIVFEAKLFLAPGTHVLSAQAPGYTPVQIQLVATPGESRRKVVRLSRLAPEPTPPLDATPSGHPQAFPPAEPYPWRVPAALVTGGLALAGAGLGGYFLYQANNADERMQELHEELASSRSPQPCALGVRSPSACDDLTSAVERRASNYNAAVVILSTAAALAVSSAVLWVWEVTDDVSVNATFLPGGVVLGGKF